MATAIERRCGMTTTIKEGEGEMVAERRRLSKDERDEIARRYQAGDSLAQIVKDLNVSRATIYYTLDTLGVPRDRQPRADVPEGVGDSAEQTLAWALRTIMQQQEQIGALKQQVSDNSSKVEQLTAQLAAALVRIQFQEQRPTTMGGGDASVDVRSI